MSKKILVALAVSLAGTAFARADVNTATRVELEAIRGVGPGIAAVTLDQRKKGAFKDWGTSLPASRASTIAVPPGFRVPA